MNQEIRKEIRDRIIEQVDAFCFHNKMSQDDFSDFMGLARYKIRNWRNSPSVANPTPVDIYLIDLAQRSSKARHLNFHIDTIYVISGPYRTIQEIKKIKEISTLKRILREREKHIYLLENK